MESQPQVFSANKLQAWVGLTALLLPLVLGAIGWLLRVDGVILNSISDYHGSNLRFIFTGAMALIGVLMLSYRGYDRTNEGKHDLLESRAANLAGLAALCVAAIPNDPDENSLGQLLPYPQAEVGHFVAAAVVFLTMFWFCKFRFTMSDHLDAAHRTSAKNRRNFVYHTCSWLILASLVWLFAIFVSRKWPFPLPDMTESWPNVIFWAESLGLMAFGAGWLTKSKIIWKFGD